jgi:hypothetical protein
MQAHGTCHHRAKPESELRWGMPYDLADKISCYTRRFAEPAGSWEGTTLLTAEGPHTAPITFYDSVTGAPLFVAPVRRVGPIFSVSLQTAKELSLMRGHWRVACVLLRVVLCVCLCIVRSALVRSAHVVDNRRICSDISSRVTHLAN